MSTFEFLKDVDRTIAVGNRRVVITFDERELPQIHNGIMPGDYLFRNHKNGLYCSASICKEDVLVGIFINTKGDYILLSSLKEKPCRRENIKLRECPSNKKFQEIEEILPIINNSLIAMKREPLPKDLSSYFWGSENRFFYNKKRPLKKHLLKIKNYWKLNEDRRYLENRAFVTVWGGILRRLNKNRLCCVDILKEHGLLLIHQDEGEPFHILYQTSPNVFYILNSRLYTRGWPYDGYYQKLLSIPEVKKGLKLFPEKLKHGFFTYKDWSQSGQWNRKNFLGISFIFRDGWRAVIYPYSFSCGSLADYKKIVSGLPKYIDTPWNFLKREHLIEISHSIIFKKKLKAMGINESFEGEWACSQNLKENILNVEDVESVYPNSWSTEDAYKYSEWKTRSFVTLGENIKFLLAMYR